MSISVIVLLKWIFLCIYALSLASADGKEYKITLEADKAQLRKSWDDYMEAVINDEQLRTALLSIIDNGHIAVDTLLKASVVPAEKLTYLSSIPHSLSRLAEQVHLTRSFRSSLHIKGDVNDILQEIIDIRNSIQEDLVASVFEMVTKKTFDNQKFLLFIAGAKMLGLNLYKLVPEHAIHLAFHQEQLHRASMAMSTLLTVFGYPFDVRSQVWLLLEYSLASNDEVSFNILAKALAPLEVPAFIENRIVEKAMSQGMDIGPLVNELVFTSLHIPDGKHYVDHFVCFARKYGIDSSPAVAVALFYGSEELVLSLARNYGDFLLEGFESALRYAQEENLEIQLIKLQKYAPFFKEFKTNPCKNMYWGAEIFHTSEAKAVTIQEFMVNNPLLTRNTVLPDNFQIMQERVERMEMMMDNSIAFVRALVKNHNIKSDAHVLISDLIKAKKKLDEVAHDSSVEKLREENEVMGKILWFHSVNIRKIVIQIVLTYLIKAKKKLNEVAHDSSVEKLREENENEVMGKILWFHSVIIRKIVIQIVLTCLKHKLEYDTFQPVLDGFLIDVEKEAATEGLRLMVEGSAEESFDLFNYLIFREFDVKVELLAALHFNYGSDDIHTISDSLKYTTLANTMSNFNVERRLKGSFDQ
ncbi:hypothetical protein MP638_002554 [Amoeboaphelidium occidentale]|nr:hypothetical protein MP638_002554 [Amoeboaphelidium occidentale]